MDVTCKLYFSGRIVILHVPLYIAFSVVIGIVVFSVLYKVSGRQHSYVRTPPHYFYLTFWCSSGQGGSCSHPWALLVYCHMALANFRMSVLIYVHHCTKP